MIRSDGEHETVQYEETIQINKYIALKRTFLSFKDAQSTNTYAYKCRGSK